MRDVSPTLSLADIEYNRRGLLAPEQYRVLVGNATGALRAELAPSAPIVRIPAQVVWKSQYPCDRYRVEPRDGSGAIEDSHAPLSPGPYWCYVMPRSRFLVAAESPLVPEGAWSV